MAPNTTEVPILREDTPVMVPIVQDRAARIWQLIAMFLGLIISGGFIVGVLGRQFYVPREEYTAKVLQDTALQTELKAGLAEIKARLSSQDGKLSSIADKVDRLEIDFAKVRK